MENASKALIIAGEVLIAILVIAVAILLFTASKGLPDEYNNQMSVQEIQKFNASFTKYIKTDNVGNEYITPQDVVSIYQLVKNHQNDGIDIELIMPKEFTTPEEFLKDNLPVSDGADGLTDVKFILNIDDYTTDNRIKKMRIE